MYYLVKKTLLILGMAPGCHLVKKKRKEKCPASLPPDDHTVPHSPLAMHTHIYSTPLPT